MTRRITPYERDHSEEDRVADLRRTLRHCLFGPGPYPGDDDALAALALFNPYLPSSTSRLMDRFIQLVEGLTRQGRMEFHSAMERARKLGTERWTHKELGLPEPKPGKKSRYEPPTACVDPACACGEHSDVFGLRRLRDGLETVFRARMSHEEMVVGIQRVTAWPAALTPLLLDTEQRLGEHGWGSMTGADRMIVGIAQQVLYRVGQEQRCAARAEEAEQARKQAEATARRKRDEEEEEERRRKRKEDDRSSGPGPDYCPYCRHDSCRCW
ncbi:MAG: hypothetical protein IT477_10605 [Rhodanobacteraceae bacterium]|nr:hypothetical protein [Rhodanobacteraceae bacterium]